MTQKEILAEAKKCKESPYYFATKYVIIKNDRNKVVPFSTPLKEEEFNKMFKNYEKKTIQS